MQWTRTRDVREQILHLVGKHAPALEINVLGIGWSERYGYQLHGRLFRCAAALVIVATPARGRDIVPGIATASREWRDVIASQVASRITHRAVKAQVGVTLEQGAVI